MNEGNRRLIVPEISSHPWSAPSRKNCNQWNFIGPGMIPESDPVNDIQNQAIVAPKILMRDLIRP
jgi:hypothetical protein